MFKAFIRSVMLKAFGRVAQLGEHRPYKPRVTGSSPVPPTIEFIKMLAGITTNLYFGGVAQLWLERRPVKPEVASSSLVVPANKFKQTPYHLPSFIRSPWQNKTQSKLFEA